MEKNSDEILKNSVQFLKNYGLGGDHMIVVLYIIFLRLANINFEIRSERSSTGFKGYFIALALIKDDFLVIFKINEIVEKFLAEWPEGSFYDLTRLYDSQEVKIEERDKRELFEDLIYSYDKHLGKSNSVGILPQGLVNELFHFIDLPKNPKIYNPFAGFASLSQRPYSKFKGTYIGQELNQAVWAIASMRLIVNGHDINPDLRLEDSIKNWLEFDEFDLIAAFPPFNMKIRKHLSEFRHAKTAEEFVLRKGIKNLNSQGKLLCVVSNGFLFRGGSDKSCRKEIIEDNLLESVFSFPGNLLKNTGIPFSILIIDQNKKSEKFKFYNLEAEYSGKRETNMILNAMNDSTAKYGLDWKSLFASVKDNTSENFMEVGIKDLRESDYNLNVPRYFVDSGAVVSLKNPEKIGELSEVIEGEKVKSKIRGRFVRIRDLNEEGAEFTLNLKKIGITEVPKYSTKIDESCLLLSLRWSSLKPTFFNYVDKPIYISKDIIALRLYEEKIDPAYLINELKEPYVVYDQLEKYQVGGTHPTIHWEDLLKIKIEVLSPKEQRAKVKGIFTAFSQSRTKELELQKEILGYRDEAFREFASIKHTIRQYLSALSSNISGTHKFLARNEGKAIDLNMTYSKNLNQSLGDHLEKANNTIDALNDLLRVTEVSRDNNEKPIFQNPLDLIYDAQKTFKNPEIFKFSKLYIDKPAFSEIGGTKNCNISISKEDFQRVFSNIISNAVNHGFKNINSQNLIKIELTLEEKMVKIIISNNGQPIPKDFDFNRLKTRGEKTTDSKGSGIGGSDIYQILKSWDADFEMINIENEEFPVRYILKFDNWVSKFTL